VPSNGTRLICADYVTDLTHFLDKSGAIGPAKGPARAMAQFQVDGVAHASDARADVLPAPKCFQVGSQTDACRAESKRQP
jgi:hypothetical protein